MLRLCAVALVVILGSLSTVPARAGGQGADVEAAAQAAFDEGMRLMEGSQYEKACARIEQSLELAPGMAAQFRLAECYEKLNRVASAWRNYREVAQAADAAGMLDRAKLAWERADALKHRLATLTIAVPDAVAAVPGLRITWDGQALLRELWNTPVPVDVVAVRVDASAPGREPWSTAVVVEFEGAHARVEVPPFNEPRGTGPQLDTGLSGQTVAGIVLTVVGVGGMAAGVAIGLEAQPRYDATTEDPNLCTPEGICSQEGLAIRNDVRVQGNIATAVFVAGAASLVGGVVLWLTAPGGEEPQADDAVAAKALGKRSAAPRVGLGLSPGGVLLRGRW